jgi:hypothetical protein
VLFNAGATALTMQDAESKAKIDDYTAQPLYLRAKVLGFCGLKLLVYAA